MTISVVGIQVLAQMLLITEASCSHNNCRGNTFPLQTKLEDTEYHTRNLNYKIVSIWKTLNIFILLFSLKKKKKTLELLDGVIIIYMESTEVVKKAFLQIHAQIEMSANPTYRKKPKSPSKYMCVYMYTCTWMYVIYLI